MKSEAFTAVKVFWAATQYNLDTVLPKRPLVTHGIAHTS